MKPKQIENSSMIAFLQGDANYTIVHFENGRSATEPCTLKRYEEKLKSFVRISRSHLINPRFVHKIGKDGMNFTVKLWNGIEIPVSRRKHSVINEFKPYL